MSQGDAAGRERTSCSTDAAWFSLRVVITGSGQLEILAPQLGRVRSNTTRWLPRKVANRRRVYLFIYLFIAVVTGQTTKSHHTRASVSAKPTAQNSVTLLTQK